MAELLSSVCIYKGVDENGKYDFSPDIKKILSVVKLLKGAFGMITYIGFIRGMKQKRFAGSTKNSLYGCGKSQSDEWWKEIGLYTFFFAVFFLYRVIYKSVSFNLSEKR